MSATSAISHQFLPTRATLSILSDEEYTLVVELDLIELIQTFRQLEGSSEELIDQARNLPYPELTKILKQAKSQMTKDIHIYIDQQLNPPTRIKLPSDQDVFILLRSDPFNVNYRITATSEGRMPLDSHSIQVQLPDYLGTVNLMLNSPKFLLVKSGEKSDPYTIAISSTSTNAISQLMTYSYQGMIHIIPEGLDHILFVLALFLLTARISSLIWQVTAFTIAHTVTLIMASYGLIQLSANIVEPLIAFSIVFVAVENLVHSNLRPWRILIVFIFGLLHGLGFASMLIEMGLPEGLRFVSLIAFNVGVEAGQLIVLILAFLLVGWFRQRNWYRWRVIVPGSVGIAVTGLVWTFQRLTELF